MRGVELERGDMAFDAATIARINRVFRAFALTAGLAVLLGGGYWMHRNHLDEFLAKRAVAEGQVIENREEHWSEANSVRSHTSYRAIVRFTDQRGQDFTYSDAIAFNPASFYVGERVKVFYDPLNPQHAMIDRGEKNYVIPLVCVTFGGLMVIGGLQGLLKTGLGGRD